MSALGPFSVNQAAKALAVANKYLVDDGFSLQCRVERVESVEEPELRDLFELDISRSSVQTNVVHEYAAMRCAKDSDPEALAADIVPKIHENSCVQIQSIGPRAVFKAVDSICCARQTLLEEGFDLSFVPEFEDIEFDDNVVRTGVNFYLLVAQA